MAVVTNEESGPSPPLMHSPEQSDSSKTPRNVKSSPFSISAILSEEIGRKRNLSSHVVSSREKKPRLSDAGSTAMAGGTSGSPVAGGTISLAQAGNLMLSPQQIAHSGVQGSPLPMTSSTPGRVFYPLTPLNSSLTTSPFNASVLSALGQQQSPGPQEDVFTDSLGMLSTVALYHSEISNTSCGTPIHEKVDALRLTSASEHFDGSHATFSFSNSSLSSESVSDRKTGTPYILKKDKRRRRQPSVDSTSDHSHRIPDNSGTHLNTGFLSPTSTDVTFSQQLVFSPSIFLRRPPERETTLASPLSTVDHNLIAGSVLSSSLCSDPECTIVSSSGADVGPFITSTPKKENTHPPSSLVLVGRTPSQRSPGVGVRSNHMRDDLLNGSDSEQPVKRARRVPKKSRARTKLSPLLENACSPIAKSHPPQPSSLLSSTFVPTPTGIFPYTYAPPMAIQSYAIPHSANLNRSAHHHSVDFTSRVTYPSSDLSVLSSRGEPTSQTHLSSFNSSMGYQHQLPQYMMSAGSSKWMSSPAKAQWDQRGQIQCVPPRFIFAQNQAETKRSRLTEAINRSLSETPSDNPKLPAEWTKYACGQTADQKALTDKAKNFLQCRPRHLTFDGMS